MEILFSIIIIAVIVYFCYTQSNSGSFLKKITRQLKNKPTNKHQKDPLSKYNPTDSNNFTLK